MATNELAAILARRRAKDGSGSAVNNNAPPAVAFSSNENSPSSSNTTVSPASCTGASADPTAKRSSIAERIARLQQQSANAAPAATTPVPIALHRNSARAEPSVLENQPTTTPNPGGWPSSVGASTTATPTPASAQTSTPAASAVPAMRTSWTSVSSSSAADASSSPIAASTSNVPAPLTGEPSSNVSPSASTEWKRPSRTSDRIAQLQGNLGGFGMNPFRPGAAPPIRRAGGGESIMTTGDQYAAAHGMPMGVAMPGMGAAVPMPGLAKAGARIPGMMQPGSDQNENEPAAAPDVEHATMSRAAGPKRRAPTRMPPGAVRIPGAGPFVVTSPASQEPQDSPATGSGQTETVHTPVVAVPAVSASPSAPSQAPASFQSSWTPQTESATATATVPQPSYQTPPLEFPTSVSTPAAVSPSIAVPKPSYQAPPVQPAYQPPVAQKTYEPAPIKHYTSPADELFAAFTPEELNMAQPSHVDAVATSTVAKQPGDPAPSSLFGKDSSQQPPASATSWNSVETSSNQSNQQATTGAVKEPLAMLHPKPESPKPCGASSSDSLFGVPEASVSVASLSISSETTVETKAEPQGASSLFGASSGAPVQFTSSWNSTQPSSANTTLMTTPAAAPAVSSVSSAPKALAPPPRMAGESLFGAATADDSSESDWSDNEDDQSPKRPSATLFAPTNSAAAQPVKPTAPNNSLFSGEDSQSSASASVSVAPPSNVSSGYTAYGSAGSLFGESSNAPPAQPSVSATPVPVPAPAPAPAPSAAARQPGTTLVPPPKMANYSNLFGASDEESSSDSEDEGGLFGTGLPSKR